jgi:hypothetical protein
MAYTTLDHGNFQVDDDCRPKSAAVRGQWEGRHPESCIWCSVDIAVNVTEQRLPSRFRACRSLALPYHAWKEQSSQHYCVGNMQHSLQYGRLRSGVRSGKPASKVA